MNVFSKRPWLFVVIAFLLLISAWAITIVIAERHRPVPVPLQAR